MDKRAMYKIGYGLYLLSSESRGRRNACIVNTFAQIISNPPVVVLGLNKVNYTHKLVAERGESPSVRFRNRLLLKYSGDSGFNAAGTPTNFRAYFAIKPPTG